MSIFRRLSLLVCAGVLALLLSGCERQKGPAERTGEQIDEAVEEAKDALERAEERMRESTQ